MCEMYLVYLFLLFRLFAKISADDEIEMLCDVYQTWDSELEERQTIFTIVNYPFPKSRGKLIEPNVPCPCGAEGNFCLRKCCLPDDAFTLNKECHPSDLTTELQAIEFMKLLNVTNASRTWVIYGSFCPSAIEKIDLSVPIPRENDYCIDYFDDAKSYLMLKCVSTDIVEAVSPIFTISLGISIVFLLLTFAVYAFIQSLRSLPGKILLAYVLSLMTTDTFYLIMQVMMITEGTFCLCIAYVIHFSFLATFFWLNVMCFDLWWTFSGYRAFNGLSKEKARKRFIFYCLYAWGCPALICTGTFIIDNTNGIFQDHKPKLGLGNRCWFGDDVAVFYYFYSFVSVLLCLNFIMFLHTTTIIMTHNKNHGKYLEGDGNQKHFLDKEKRRFYVYLKLFSMMGINWLLEILSYVYLEQTPSIIWDVIDVFNLLQGAFIFMIFVCKRRVIVLLNKRIYPKKMLIKDSSRMNSFYTSGPVANSSVAHKEKSKSSTKTETIPMHSSSSELKNDSV